MIATKAAKALRMLDALRGDVQANVKALEAKEIDPNIVLGRTLLQIDALANVLQHMLREDVR